MFKKTDSIILFNIVVLGPVVQSWFSVCPRLKLNPLFWFEKIYEKYFQVYKKVLENLL